ncbi:hypothetical protein NOF04DRAFT_1196098, partial [Fusarium oxysporum II5]
ALSITGSHVITYLREKHYIPEDARKGLTKILRSIPGLLSPNLIQPRKDGIIKHPHLRTHDGFHCDRGCNFRTASFQLIKRHFSDQQMQGKCLHFGETRSFKDLDSLFHYVYLQTWASGPGRQYWIVKRNGSQQRPIGGEEVQNHLRLVREREPQHKQPGLPLNHPPPQVFLRKTWRVSSFGPIRAFRFLPPFLDLKRGAFLSIDV